MQPVALLLDDDMDAHRLFQLDAVVIDEALGFVAAVAPIRRRRRAPALARSRTGARSSASTLSAPYLRDEFGEPPFAEPVGAELAANIAEHEFRRAAVGGDDALDVGIALRSRAGSAPPAGAGLR